MKSKYTVIIQWSDEDNCYIVSLPEWGPYCKTYGDTYEEAAKNAAEALELLMDKSGDPDPTMPDPKLFEFPGADVCRLADDPSRITQLQKAS